MIMTSNTSTTFYKNQIVVTDTFGNELLLVRSDSNSNIWHNIARCEINTNGHIDENDGLVSNATSVHAEEVAYLLAESEAREEQLERIESLLEEWINLRRSGSRKAKHRLRLQKQEVV